MNNRPPSRPDSEILSEPVAARLLERASELDVAHRAGSAVVDLRAAAAEAGISASAFDAALVELHDSQKTPLPFAGASTRRRSRTWALIGAVAALIALYAIARSRAPTPVSDVAVPGVPIVEEAIQLRCLSPGEAAELIRPLLQLRSNTVVYSPANAPRLIVIRATVAQMRSVRSLLEKHEGVGSPTCATRTDKTP